MNQRSKSRLRDVPGMLLLLVGVVLMRLAGAVGGDRTNEALEEFLNGRR